MVNSNVKLKHKYFNSFLPSKGTELQNPKKDEFRTHSNLKIGVPLTNFC